MTESAKLRIPYIAASQAQKHVTHNEAMTLLDTLVQASVIDKDLTTPPMSPAEGDCYIVAATGTGDWTGWDNLIARFIDGEWPLFGAPDEYAGVRLAGTGSIRKLVATPDVLDPPSIERLTRVLAAALPAKS